MKISTRRLLTSNLKQAAFLFSKKVEKFLLRGGAKCLSQFKQVSGSDSKLIRYWTQNRNQYDEAPEVRNFRGLHHVFRLLGSSQITPLKVSDASSLLTSLRTVSGFHWFRVFRRHYDVCERHYFCHVGAGQGQAASGKLRTIVAWHSGIRRMITILCKRRMSFFCFCGGRTFPYRFQYRGLFADYLWQSLLGQHVGPHVCEIGERFRSGGDVLD